MAVYAAWGAVLALDLHKPLCDLEACKIGVEVVHARCRQSAVGCRYKALFWIFSRIVEKNPDVVGGNRMQGAGPVDLPTGRWCGLSLSPILKSLAISSSGKCLRFKIVRLEERAISSIVASTIQKGVHEVVAARTRQVVVKH